MNPDDEYIDDNDPLADSSPAADSEVERGGAPTPDAPSLSLRDTLAKAFKEDDPGQQQTLSGERPRNPDGTFAAKNIPVVAADKGALTPGAPGVANPPTATEAKPNGQASSTAPVGPPPGWSPEAKAVFTSLPPAVQQAVAKREQEVSAGFQQYAGLKQRNDDFERAIAPNRHIYAGQGVSDAQAIANIWQWFHAIKDSPEQAFPALAEMVGFDLSAVGFATADGQDHSSQHDPRLVQALSQLESRLNGLTSWQEQQQRTALDSQINAWANGKPHFAAVRQDMGRLMQAGVVPMGDLDAAYAYATAAKGLQSTPQPTAPPAPAADPARRVVQARHAAVSPRPTGPNGAKPSNASRQRSLREEIEMSMGGGG